jgi:hypothetical protein
MDREQAKEFTHSLITTLVYVVLAASTCMTLCFTGCCLLAINKVKKNQQFTESYLDNHQPNINGTYAIANQLDTSADNHGIISRGMAIN